MSTMPSVHEIISNGNMGFSSYATARQGHVIVRGETIYEGTNKAFKEFAKLVRAAGAGKRAFPG
ncbi:MAG: hypothetical protein AMXMBFR7_28560 [Planctomycetota bacterium]